MNQSHPLYPWILALVAVLAFSGALALSLHAPLRAQAGTTLFSDDFEADPLGSPAAGWTVVSGNWTVAMDGSHVLKDTDTSTASRYSVTAGSTSWTDYSVVTSFKAGTAILGTSNVVAARYQDDNNAYSLILKDGRSWYFGKKVAGVWTTFASGNFTYDTVSWYTLRIDLAGSSLAAYLNGNQLATASDTSFKSGAIDFMSRYVAEFDNVSVTSLPAPVPTPTPTPTASTTPTPSASASATPTPTTSASPSPTPSATSPPPAPSGALLFSDDFELDPVGSPPANWTPNTPTWTVALDGSNVLRQTDTNIGTLKSVKAGSAGWADYSVSATVKPGTSQLGTTNTINARYIDDNNTYALLLKGNDLWFFGKKVAGTWTTFASGNFNYNTMTWYTMRIDAVGSSVAAYLNGALMASATDSSYTSGAIAFASNHIMEVDNVAVMPLTAPAPTPMASATPTPSASASPSPTVSPAPSPTPTATSTPTPTPTPSPTPPQCPGCTGMVSGTVTSAATGATLAGTVVSTQPTTSAVSTDVNGNYQMTIPTGNYSVVFTLSGYNSNFVGNVIVNQNAATTAGVGLAPITPLAAQDLFSRPDQNGFGTASDGSGWADDAASYPTGTASVSNRMGWVQTYSALVDRDEWMGISYQDQEVSADFDLINVDPYHGANLIARLQGGSSGTTPPTWVELTIHPASQRLLLWVQANGVWTKLASSPSPLTLSLNAWYHAKLDAVGPNLYGKVWAFGTPEPDWQVTAAQTSVTTAGVGGLRTTNSDIYWANYRETSVGISGQVTDATTGAPLAGATVTLSNGATVTTGPTGVYVFTGLGGATYTVTASAPGKVTQSAPAGAVVGTAALVNFSM